jgi:uncharacterized BrkB/YihY/UPF0761 family membrane protein
MQFHNQEQVMNWILDFANNTLEQTSGGWLAGIGVAFLFSTVGQLLRYVESTFNSIWKVEETRVWYRQVTDYLAVIILVPALFVASSSATVLGTTRLNEILSQSDMLEGLKPVVSFLVQAYSLHTALHPFHCGISCNAKHQGQVQDSAGCRACRQVLRCRFFR